MTEFKTTEGYRGFLSDDGFRGATIIQTRDGYHVCRYRKGVRQVHGSDVFAYGYWIGNKPCFRTEKKAEEFAKMFLTATNKTV